MPELYDQVKQTNSKYIPKFVGSNFDTLKSVGDNLDNRYRANEALMSDALAASLNEQYAPGDEHIGLSIYDKLKDLRHQIANSDDNFENSTSLVRNAVRDHISTNRDRIEGLRNAAEYKKYENDLRTLGSEGVDLTPRDSNGKVFSGTVNPDGSYNRFKYKVQKAEPILETKEKLFNQMEADKTQGAYIPGVGELSDFLTSKINGGITSKKVEEYASKGLLRYKDTPAYKQDFAIIKRDNPNMSARDIDEQIKTSIVATGLERVHNMHLEDLQAKSAYAIKAAHEGSPSNGDPSFETTEVKEYKPEILNRSKLSVSVPINKTINKGDHYIIGGERFPINAQTTKLYEQNLKAGNAKLVEEYQMGDGEVLPRSETLDDLYKTITEKDKNSIVKGYENNYNSLQEEEKTNFESIVKYFKPDANSSFLKSEDAFKLVNKYLDDVESKQINEITPVITQGYDDVVSDDGKTLRDKETDNVRANFSSRVFYNPATGTKISGSSPTVLKEFNDEFDSSFKTIDQLKDALDVRGEFSPKNLFKHTTKNNALIDPLAATINGKDVAVTRRASDLQGSRYNTHKLINDAYTALKKLPGIPAKVNLAGTNFNIRELEDGRIELKTGQRTFTLDNLEDLPQLFTEK
jgi:hypothetical protein